MRFLAAADLVQFRQLHRAADAPVGINLLGVGLHSYGFTDGAATALLTYCGLQLLVVFILAPWAAKRVGQKIL